MEVPNEEYRPLFGGEMTDKPLFGVSNRRVTNICIQIHNLF